MPQGRPWITSAGNIDKLLKRQLLGAKNIPSFGAGMDPADGSMAAIL